MKQSLNRDQLVLLVKKIINCEGTEAEVDKMIRELRANVIDPEVCNLIFHNEPELAAEEIVDKALSYKPIQISYEPR